MSFILLPSIQKFEMHVLFSFGCPRLMWCLLSSVALNDVILLEYELMNQIPRLGHSSHSFYFIPYYFKPFHFLNSTNHSILFHFFSTFFFNFPNPYTISLNLNHLYHLEIHKVKPYNIIFFQTIPNYFQTILTIPINRMEWPKWFAQTQCKPFSCKLLIRHSYMSYLPLNSSIIL